MKTDFLLDTNILSETLRPRPNLALHKRLSSTLGDRLFTSSICLVELRVWACRGPDPGARWERVKNSILPNIKVLDFQPADAECAGDILCDLETSGRPSPHLDAFIAATAIRHGMTLVTRNVRHFQHVRGLQVDNWFEGAS